MFRCFTFLPYTVTLAGRERWVKLWDLSVILEKSCFALFIFIFVFFLWSGPGENSTPGTASICCSAHVQETLNLTID